MLEYAYFFSEDIITFGVLLLYRFRCASRRVGVKRDLKPLVIVALILSHKGNPSCKGRA